MGWPWLARGPWKSLVPPDPQLSGFPPPAHTPVAREHSPPLPGAQGLPAAASGARLLCGWARLARGCECAVGTGLHLCVRASPPRYPGPLEPPQPTHAETLPHHLSFWILLTQQRVRGVSRRPCSEASYRIRGGVRDLQRDLMGTGILTVLTEY